MTDGKEEGLDYAIYEGRLVGDDNWYRSEALSASSAALSVASQAYVHKNALNQEGRVSIEVRIESSQTFEHFIVHWSVSFSAEPSTKDAS